MSAGQHRGPRWVPIGPVPPWKGRPSVAAHAAGAHESTIGVVRSSVSSWLIRPFPWRWRRWGRTGIVEIIGAILPIVLTIIADVILGGFRLKLPPSPPSVSFVARSGGSNPVWGDPTDCQPHGTWTYSASQAQGSAWANAWGNQCEVPYTSGSFSPMNTTQFVISSTSPSDLPLDEIHFEFVGYNSSSTGGTTVLASGSLASMMRYSGSKSHRPNLGAVGNGLVARLLDLPERERAKSTSVFPVRPRPKMPANDVALETFDLGYAYAPGKFAVRHLSLGVRRGEVLGLLGRNGAGKTTTVRLLTTLLPPTEGTAVVLGQDIREGGRALRSRIGVELQSESLDFVTVERNLMLYAFLWAVPRETAKSRAEEMIELFELESARRRKPWALSGGERRRFQVARELMHDMEVLFLDEPTVGLDAIARRRILRYLKERAQRGLSIVFTTHILHEADLLCDRIAVLHLGQLIALDTAEALKQRHGGAREVSVVFRTPLPVALRHDLAGELGRLGAQLLAPEADLPRLENGVVVRAERADEFLPWIGRWAESHSLAVERMAVEEATLEGAFLGMIGDASENANGGEDARRPPETPPSGRLGGVA